MLIKVVGHGSRLAAVISLLLLLVAGPSEPALAGDRLRLRYDLYISSMRAIEINQEIELAGGAYSSAMSVRSQGMAGLFMKIETDMKTTGSIVDGMPVPGSFKIAQKDRRATVKWNDPKKPDSVREPEINPRKADSLDAALAEPAVDPLTALLHQGFAGVDKVCSGAERVYNGREVAEYRFDRLDDERFGDNDASVYRGPVVRCRLVYRLVAGFSDRAMEKNRAEPVVITFWAAPVKTAAAEQPLMLVVALSGKVDDRPLKGYLNAATISGRPLNPASLASR
jgi:hypothetical protein